MPYHVSVVGLWKLKKHRGDACRGIRQCGLDGLPHLPYSIYHLLPRKHLPQLRNHFIDMSAFEDERGEES